MFNLKLKQAEKAFSDGRLDESFELLRKGKISSHRQGQRLMTKLAAGLADRGNEHLAAGRIESALSDCNKAEKLGGNLAAAAELRAGICAAIEEKRFTGSQQQALISDARKNIENGMHSVGRQILEKAGRCIEADVILEDVSVLSAKAEAVAGKAAGALGRRDINTACDILAAAGLKVHNGGPAAEIILQVKSELCEKITEKLNAGRIDLAESYLGRLFVVCPDCVEVKEFGLAVELCGQAWKCVRSGDISGAAGNLERLKVILPKAGWVDKAAVNALKAAEAINKLMVGPLSMVYSDAADAASECDNEELPVVLKAERDILKRDVVTENVDAPFPWRFVMQIDGVGSYLVACDDSVTVGPVSSAKRPVVGLVAQPDLAVVEIERNDGDYFIRSDKPFAVNDMKFCDKLLADGDRISLSMRCRMKFNMPNAASSTAVVSLASARYINSDVRNVILMDREILIGASNHCHVAAGQIDESLVIFRRGNKMYCRADKSGEVELFIDKPVSIAGINLAVKKM